MSLLSALGLASDKPDEEPEAAPFVERRAEVREPVFQEVVLALEDYHRIRAVIVDLSSRGARIQFSERTELPFRIRLSAPLLRLNCWARVVWQHDEAAGLEFLADEDALANG
jgi:hypothetical protein